VREERANPPPTSSKILMASKGVVGSTSRVATPPSILRKCRATTVGGTGPGEEPLPAPLPEPPPLAVPADDAEGVVLGPVTAGATPAPPYRATAGPAPEYTAAARDGSLRLTGVPELVRTTTLTYAGQARGQAAGRLSPCVTWGEG
jgi:hypothetical protein